MSSANWPPANDEQRARLLAELVKRDAGSPSMDLSGDEESTIRDLEARLDTLVGTLREPPPLDDFAEESDCRRATELVKRLVADVDPHSAPLDRVGPYVIEAKLGEGGMGTVYKAIHSKLKRVVAIKVLPARRTHRADAIARFAREMEAIGALHHPNIVAAHDAAEENGMHYLVMEFVDGIDLSALSRAVGPLAPAAACEIVRQAAFGLAETHQRGIVHRDIKPSNIMLATPTRGDDKPTVKILDFGLALLASQEDQAAELTATDQIMGTLNYMAPEQGSRSHAVDARADVYSLGATLYRLLAGQPPFAGKDSSPWAVITALATEEPTPLSSLRSDLPTKLVAIVNRMMAKNPADRFASAAEVAEVLAPWGRGARLAEFLLATTTDVDSARIPAPRTESAGLARGLTGNSSQRSDAFRWILLFAGVVLLALAAVLLSRQIGVSPDVVPSEQTTDELVAGSRAVARWLASQRADFVIRTLGGDFIDLRAGDTLPNETGQLISANLDGNKSLSRSDLARFDGLPSFISLGLSRTNVGDKELQNLGELPELGVLFLADTRVGDAGLEALKRYPRLTVLHLYGTRVTDDGLEHLANLRMLTDLSLVDCSVTDRGLKHLAGLNRLKILALDRTGVTSRGVAEMRLVLPNCTIRSNFTDEEIRNAAVELAPPSHQ